MKSTTRYQLYLKPLKMAEGVSAIGRLNISGSGNLIEREWEGN